LQTIRLAAKKINLREHLSSKVMKEGLPMARNRLLMTTAALGAAYLLRNDKTRKKLVNQLQAFADKSRR
jgi:hypothetical protein